MPTLTARETGDATYRGTAGEYDHAVHTTKKSTARLVCTTVLLLLLLLLDGTVIDVAVSRLVPESSGKPESV